MRDYLDYYQFFHFATASRHLREPVGVASTANRARGIVSRKSPSGEEGLRDRRDQHVHYHHHRYLRFLWSLKESRRSGSSNRALLSLSVYRVFRASARPLSKLPLIYLPRFTLLRLLVPWVSVPLLNSSPQQLLQVSQTWLPTMVTIRRPHRQ